MLRHLLEKRHRIKLLVFVQIVWHYSRQPSRRTMLCRLFRKFFPDGLSILHTRGGANRRRARSFGMLAAASRSGRSQLAALRWDPTPTSAAQNCCCAADLSAVARPLAAGGLSPRHKLYATLNDNALVRHARNKKKCRQPTIGGFGMPEVLYNSKAIKEKIKLLFDVPDQSDRRVALVAYIGQDYADYLPSSSRH